jgi:hypothetical protein
LICNELNRVQYGREFLDLVEHDPSTVPTNETNRVAADS